ncbi:MAG TPA: HAMP domain-containing sensor histidine kinase, partial [Gemmatimonadaceae bacterium]|nr:HAMP domain-containing sensor histidine kinase [Gemmatimonadaceae bacterium]
MSTKESPDGETHRLAVVARVCGGAAFAIGALVLSGWAFDVAILRNFVPGMIIMIPTTAVGFVVAGLGVVAATYAERAVARWWTLGAAAATTVLGAIAMVERLASADLGIDRLMFFEKVRQYPYLPPGRMATNTAVCFGLAGIALTGMALGRPRMARSARIVAGIGVSIAMLALVGYLYGARQFYKFDAAAGMAFITAVAFGWLFFGLLLLQSANSSVALLTGSDLGSALVRQLLPWIIGIPILLGRVWIGARNNELISREGAAATFAIVTMVTLGVIVVRNALELRRVDIERRGALAREAAGRARAEELQRTAEIANEVKVHLLATMSHELRTPLNAIGGYTQLMALGMRGPITPEQRHDLARVDASTKYLAAIIGDILAFAKSEAGEVEMQIRATTVRCLVDGLDVLVGPHLSTRNVRFEVRPTDPDIDVMADSERASQILVNLVANAIKFTPDGGSVTVSCGVDDRGAQISVSDTGIGIAAEHLDRIFTPFVQIDRTLTGPNRGVGLGLSISRDLAR